MVCYLHTLPRPSWTAKFREHSLDVKYLHYWDRGLAWVRLELGRKYIRAEGWSSVWRFVKWQDFSLMYVCCWKRTDTFSGQTLFALLLLSSSLFDVILHWIIILQGECWYLLVDNVGLHWAPLLLVILPGLTAAMPPVPATYHFLGCARIEADLTIPVKSADLATISRNYNHATCIGLQQGCLTLSTPGAADWLAACSAWLTRQWSSRTSDSKAACLQWQHWTTLQPPYTAFSHFLIPTQSFSGRNLLCTPRYPH